MGSDQGGANGTRTPNPLLASIIARILRRSSGFGEDARGGWQWAADGSGWGRAGVKVVDYLVG
jgi:hypothetical protein